MDKFLGVVRHILTGVGGSLVTLGVITSATNDTLFGSLMAIAGVIWSILDKNKTV